MVRVDQQSLQGDDACLLVEVVVLQGSLVADQLILQYILETYNK